MSIQTDTACAPWGVRGGVSSHRRRWGALSFCSLLCRSRTAKAVFEKCNESSPRRQWKGWKHKAKAVSSPPRQWKGWKHKVKAASHRGHRDPLLPASPVVLVAAAAVIGRRRVDRGGRVRSGDRADFCAQLAERRDRQHVHGSTANCCGRHDDPQAGVLGRLPWPAAPCQRACVRACVRRSPRAAC